MTYSTYKEAAKDIRALFNQMPLMFAFGVGQMAELATKRGYKSLDEFRAECVPYYAGGFYLKKDADCVERIEADITAIEDIIFKDDVLLFDGISCALEETEAYITGNYSQVFEMFGTEEQRNTERYNAIFERAKAKFISSAFRRLS